MSPRIAVPFGLLLIASGAPAQFVEPVRIIHEFHGEHADDEFGWVARRVGDVDNDGVADFVSTAPHTSPRTSPGKIYMYSSKSGKLLWTREGAKGALLGMGCDGAGDVNADGVPDVVCGSMGTGEAFVYSGDDGRTLLTVSAVKPGDIYGWAVSGAGDWNGDGHDDFIVGARRADESGEDAGSAYLYSGADGSVLRRFNGENPGDLFGTEVSGFTDGRHAYIAIGAMDAGPSQRGRVYVYTQRADAPVFVIDAADSGAQLGRMFINFVGDIDGDGVSDLYASDWNDRAKGQNTGRVYVYSTARGTKLHEWGGAHADDGFGIGAADAGDVNGDGSADLLIGIWNDSSRAKSAGKCQLYSGKTGRVLREITCTVAGDTFGFDTTNLGDVDGDGLTDYLITSAWATVDGKAKCGRCFIIAGQDR